MKNFFSTIGRYLHASDTGLILASLLCSAISCVMLWSIATNELLDRCDMSTVRTQIVASAMGLVIVMILSLLDYNKLIKLWWIYAPVALGLVGLTFTSLGYRRGGADDQAWIAIGDFYLQPSELLKLAFILTFSMHLSKVEENMNQLRQMMLLCFHAAVPILLVAKQGDYGTAIVFVIIFLAEMLSTRIAVRYLITALIATPVMGFLAWNFLLSDMHRQRILVILHPGTDPENLEYQQDLGISALANGQIYGTGLQSENGYVSVPEMHNDFIYSYIGQAWGLIGALLVLGLLTYICLKVLTDSLYTKNHQGKLICIGTFGMIFSHCFMNIGMVLKVMPVIGIPLPFLTAGGTAVVCMYTAIGLVNSTRCHNVRKHRMFYEAESDR
ncbi:MAG: FtsW/RodA/SpoVE family cell cycle protein [Oscillospiraceae bacterium]|nr:FtsW/RodA/SpoVE family cell cycle protein [Oscillospiraceae bacterium]